ncbi:MULTISPECIES: hypothetical protein [unclassified Aureimonas]|uniref:hypothetical protein n=1 Tax=unclassified Aureimonas TaxID=2615206 RepID=UPI0006F683AD|nr:MULTISPECIES: hypothetical protein [unclassified Aureimonas]KQT52206.1 hypothetical protein ASG62_16240 [Aureimonas sp. Leaf427]KQT70560.1 hypothetical protein ASG54_21710 [Aureimonas sp. Leaf460]
MTLVIAGMRVPSNFHVFLNGEAVADCVEADDIAGYVIVTPRDERGRLIIEGECYAQQRKTGRVEFSVPLSTPAPHLVEHG